MAFLPRRLQEYDLGQAFGVADYSQADYTVCDSAGVLLQAGDGGDERGAEERGRERKAHHCRQ